MVAWMQSKHGISGRNAEKTMNGKITVNKLLLDFILGFKKNSLQNNKMIKLVPGHFHSYLDLNRR